MLRFLTAWLLTFALVCSGVARVRTTPAAGANRAAGCCCAATCATAAPSCCTSTAPRCDCGQQAPEPEPEPSAPAPHAPRMPDLAQSREPVRAAVLAAEAVPVRHAAPTGDPACAHARPRQAELRTFLI